MKRLLPLILVMSLVLAAPALAQTITFSSDFNKTAVITEDVTITDSLTVDLSGVVDSRAIANSSVDMTNNSNVVGTSAAISGNSLNDLITNSFAAFTGIGQVNQASGDLNNQGNVEAEALVTGLAAAVQAQGGGNLNNNSNVFAMDSCALNDTIDTSFNNMVGVGQANQSAGFMNNQNNQVALGVCPTGAIVAVADTTLAMVNTANFVALSNSVVSNTVTGSFNGGFGVAQVNQSAGSMNNQTNSVAVAAGIAVTR